MDFGDNNKLNVETIRKLSEALPKDAGIFAYIIANIWLIVPFVTILIFTLMTNYLKGKMIHYMQLLYGVLTIAISFYFVDKNAHQSKSDAILSATHNALLLFGIITLAIQFNPCQKCIPVQALNILHFALMVAGFNVLSIISNKNSSSQSSIITILGLIFMQFLRIYLTV
jgi:hypothetical protein